MFDETLDRRSAPRMRLGLACRMLVDGRRYDGVLRLLSATGMLVEVPDAFPSCDGAIVAFETPGQRRFVLETRIADTGWRGHSLAALATRRVGLRIVDPPESYRDWVARASAPVASGAAA